MKLVCLLLLLWTASSVNAQIGIIGVTNAAIGIANIANKIAEFVVLLICHLTNLQNENVRSAFYSVLFNSNNPNITRCVLGCTVTGAYIAESRFRNITGIDPFGFMPLIIGHEIYNVFQYCVETNKHEKCSFFLSTGLCLVPRLFPILQRDVSSMVENLSNLTKQIIAGATHNINAGLGNVSSAAQPVIQQLETLSDLAKNFPPSLLQPQLGQTGNKTNSTLTSSVLPSIQQFSNLLNTSFNQIVPSHLTTAGVMSTTVRNATDKTTTSITPSTNKNIISTTKGTTSVIPTTNKNVILTTQSPLVNLLLQNPLSRSISSDINGIFQG